MVQELTLKGMDTVSFWAQDVKAAKEWYTKLLGIAPYFERPDAENPSYVEFGIGDYQHEIGIIDHNYAPKGGNIGTGSAVLFWHVDNVEVTVTKLLAMGATEYEPIIVREAGFVTASVVDPFGNILRVMYNPHYLQILQG